LRQQPLRPEPLPAPGIDFKQWLIDLRQQPFCKENTDERFCLQIE
jgi:hypothetical protein